MRALWLEDRRLAFRKDVSDPTPPGGEARIRVRLAGICSTDLELVKGYYPFRGVPGHEFVGEVMEAPGHDAWVGRRVVGEINATCGRCSLCARGLNTHCENRTVLGIVGRDGTFAERLALPVVNLHEVPDDLADETAVFTEPLAAALQIQRQIAVEPGQRVVVIGDGKLGLLAALSLALTGCDLTLVGKHPQKLALAEQRGIRVGFADVLTPKAADVVVECTGNADGVALAVTAVRPRGTIVLKSTYHGEARVSFAPVVVGEITLVGSRCGPFAPALELLRSGRIDVSPLIHARYPLADGLAAFEQAAGPGALKILVGP